MMAATAMKRQLEGKVTVVTGVGSGIGRASALRFAEEGALIAGFDSDATAGEATVEVIRQTGADALFTKVDVSRNAEIASAVGQVVGHFGGINALFNVVGVSGRRWGDGPAAECTEEAWDWVMQINAKSVFLCCKHVIPVMQAAGGGAIVNLSSVLGLVGGDEDFSTHAYAASKGAIISLTRAIASYYATQHIRANVVCPGLIATAMSQRAQQSDAIRDKLTYLQPLTGDFGAPEDVAEAALYLLSDRASFVTGAILTVDGGWTMR